MKKLINKIKMLWIRLVNRLNEIKNSGSKHFLFSKTLLFNSFVAMFAVLSTHSALLQSYLSDAGYMVLLVAIAGVNSALRCVTTKGIKLK